VFLAVLAERCFGFQLGRRQWIGLAVTAAGLAALAVTGGPAGDAGRSSLAALIALQAGVFAASSLLVACSIKRTRFHPSEGLVLGTAAGCLFGVSDISLKFLTHAAEGGLMSALISPWALSALAASVVAFYSSARSLQIGPALAVIAFTSVAANLIAISGGILVFRDSIGAGAPQIVGHMLAFSLVIAGAALMPAPTRARATSVGPASARPSPARSLA
jgi:drug/metabolite transporter (DMT)-like permease